MRWVLLLGFVWCAVAGAALAEQGEAEDQDPIDVVLGQRFDERHFEGCATAPRLTLNEVCAVGVECDPDVRIADYVEVYNPSSQAADLSCYAIVGSVPEPFSPSGTLEAREFRAWGERELGFRLKKGEDEVRLLRLRAGAPGYEVLDSLAIDESRGHSYRIPDGGAWRYVDVLEAEAHHYGTFGRSNETPPEEEESPSTVTGSGETAP